MITEPEITGVFPNTQTMHLSRPRTCLWCLRGVMKKIGKRADLAYRRILNTKKKVLAATFKSTYF